MPSGVTVCSEHFIQGHVNKWDAPHPCPCEHTYRDNARPDGGGCPMQRVASITIPGRDADASSPSSLQKVRDLPLEVLQDMEIIAHFTDIRGQK